MAPFTSAICFAGSDEYDIANDKIVDEKEVKPIKRNSKWNFFRCIRRKRKWRNKKVSEKEIIPCPEAVQEKVENKLEYKEESDCEKTPSNSERLNDDSCASDSSRLLCAERQFPKKELTDTEINPELYKCIACGETKSSQNQLVEHLMIHVYEGLNAAVWLSTSIANFVNNPDETDNTQTMPNSQSSNDNL